MAAGDYATMSGSLTGIVNDIRKTSFRYMTRDGVCRKLVTPLGAGAKGNSVTEPVLDPTFLSGTAGTEGTDITAFTSMTSSTRSYTATEWVASTFLTYNDLEDASEDVKAFQGQAHGVQHANKIEKKIVAVFASFTTNTITATSTTSGATGLTWAKIQAGGVLLRSAQKNAPEPYNLVISDNGWYYFTKNLVGNSNYAPTPLSDAVLDSYHLGDVTGIRIFRTYVISASSAAVGGMFSSAGIGLFVPRDMRMEIQHDASRRGYELISSLRAGARVRVPSYGVKYTFYASNPS